MKNVISLLFTIVFVTNLSAANQLSVSKIGNGSNPEVLLDNRTTGFTGTVEISGEVDPELTLEDVFLILYEGFSNNNPIDTLSVDEAGVYYHELEALGNYRLRCFVDFFNHSVYPNLRDFVAIEGEIVNLDFNETPSFEVNQLPPAYVRGTVQIDGVEFSDPLHHSIEISSDGGYDGDSTFAYAVYDEDYVIIEWRYELPVYGGYEWNVTISLEGYQPVTYSVPPLPPGETHWAEETHILYPTNSADYEILQNSQLIDLKAYPNPFNPSTTIQFSSENVAENEQITLEIYNLKGQKIRQFNIHNSKFKMNEIVWDGKDGNGNAVSSGVYLYQIKTREKVFGTEKMLLLK